VVSVLPMRMDWIADVHGPDVGAAEIATLRVLPFFESFAPAVIADLRSEKARPVRLED